MSRGVAIALIPRGGRVFLQRRPLAAPVFPGLWEFPGGKLEPGETPLQALLRELQEEIAWTPSRVEPLAVLRHTYPGGSIQLHPFRCTGAGHPRTALAWGWFRPGEWKALPMPEANRAFLPLLENPDILS